MKKVGRGCLHVTNSRRTKSRSWGSWQEVLFGANDIQEISWVPTSVLKSRDINSTPASYLQPHDNSEWGSHPSSFSILYSLSRTELEMLHYYSKDNLAKRIIQSLSSWCQGTIQFFKKSNRSLRLCFNYGQLNNRRFKNRYPLPLVQNNLLQLTSGKRYN